MDSSSVLPICLSFYSVQFLANMVRNLVPNYASILEPFYRYIICFCVLHLISFIHSWFYFFYNFLWEKMIGICVEKKWTRINMQEVIDWGPIGILAINFDFFFSSKKNTKRISDRKRACQKFASLFFSKQVLEHWQ